MANLFAVPAPVVGLMGRRPQSGRSILDMINPMQADALDEQMFAAAPNGYVESPQGMYFPADQAAQAQAMQQMQPGPQAPAQRQRVSALSVLGRAFAPNITGALDTERARLQAEADRPGQLAVSQENERIARALGPQALLALRTSPEKLGESLGYGYRPQVIGQGGIQSVAATGQRVSAPKDFTAGTGVYRSDPLSPGLQQLGEIGPTYAEQNAAERNRIDAIGAGQNTVGRYRIDAQGNPIFEAPSEFTLGDGQERYVGGQQVATNAKAGDDPAKAAARRQAALTTIGNAKSAVADAMGQVGVLSTGVLSGLIPGNQWRADLERTADTIEANLSFAELQKMREASPTGGALGGIAIRELELLGSTVASLKTSQSPEQYKRNLEKINTHLSNWEAAVTAAQAESGFSGSAPPPPPGFVLD